jgi:hypothetical protein
MVILQFFNIPFLLTSFDGYDNIVTYKGVRFYVIIVLDVKAVRAKFKNNWLMIINVLYFNME